MEGFYSGRLSVNSSDRQKWARSTFHVIYQLPLASVRGSHIQYYSLRVAFPKGPYLAKLRMPLEGAIMPGGKFAPDLNLPITLDRATPTSIYRQLCEQLRRALLDGRISRGTRLPSTRTLAQALGVSRTVTSSAYDELFAEGYLEGRHGSGTYVRKDLPPLPRLTRPAPNTSPRWLRKVPPLAREEPIPPQVIAFRLGIPSLSSLPPPCLARGVGNGNCSSATQQLWPHEWGSGAAGRACCLPWAISRPGLYPGGHSHYSASHARA